MAKQSVVPEIRSFTGKSGRNYIVVKQPRSTKKYLVYAETEFGGSKKAARDCGYTGQDNPNTNKHWDQLFS